MGFIPPVQGTPTHDHINQANKYTSQRFNIGEVIKPSIYTILQQKKRELYVRNDKRIKSKKYDSTNEEQNLIKTITGKGTTINESIWYEIKKVIPLKVQYF